MSWYMKVREVDFNNLLSQNSTDTTPCSNTMSCDEIIVFFDLETTGLNTSQCDMIQLSAVWEKRVFNHYTLPRCPITMGAQEVTGFSVSNGSLYYCGVRKHTFPLGRTLTSFITFLRSFPEPVLLAAHNAMRFDVRVLSRLLQEFSLQQQFQEVVSGFVDTYLLSKKLYPDLDSHSQENLVSEFLGETYNAHNAVADAKMLQKLYNEWDPSGRIVSRCTYAVDRFF
ncbi:DNA polymerase III PolC-type-like [Toxotes jaculatrix]|uniref:DNA polymerase III PolC-type-like n=1 Tax=Toxotes jaculatrix TaxID=941984 RepID=UPI001B3AA74B|nr:DNA polymerase III PolC-type-like [Toxotes jaculatrix]